MRISTSQISQVAIDSIVDQQARLSRVQLQIASGRRILTPADDPAGAARAIDLTQSISATRQYEENSSIAQSRLVAEEGALEGISNLLQRVRELTIQGNNDSQSAESRQLIALEIRQRAGELLSLANTRDANGEYIFAGFQSLSEAFSLNPDSTVSYNGDEGQRFLQIGSSRQVAVGDSGAEVFRLVKNGNGTFTTQDNSANTGTGVIVPGSVTDPTTYVADTYTVILGERTTVTGGAIGITDTGTNDTLQYELRVNGTLVYTANEGDSRTLAQLEADINAQVGTTGVRAYVDGGQLYLANETPTTTPITISETLTGASEDGDTVTGFFGSNLTGLTTPSNTITFNNANGFVVRDSASAIVTSGVYTDGGSISFNGLTTNITGTPGNGDRFTIAPSTNQDLFTTVQNLVTALESGATTGASLAAFHNAVNRVLVDLDRGLDNIINVRARVGARLNSIEDQSNLNQSSLLQVQIALSEVQDLDFADAISRLEQQRFSLQAAQQSFVRIQGLSLFDYIR